MTSASTDEFQQLQATAREIRELVADQLHDLVVERQAMGSDSELIEAVRHIGRIGQALAQAKGRERQAREMGLPVTPTLRDQEEQRSLLRSAVMSLGATAGSWVVAMDFEERRAATESAIANGHGRRRRRQTEEERI